jgi:hypothetical protein
MGAYLRFLLVRDMCEEVVGVPFRRCSIPYKAWPVSVTKYFE